MTTRPPPRIGSVGSGFIATGGAGIQWGVASVVMLVVALPPMALGLVMYRQPAGSLTVGAVKG